MVHIGLQRLAEGPHVVAEDARTGRQPVLQEGEDRQASLLPPIQEEEVYRPLEVTERLQSIPGAEFDLRLQSCAPEVGDGPSRS